MDEQMNDARVEAVARIIRESDVLPGSLRPPLDLYIGDAQQALINADAADREQGIHRVKVDDAMVERVARVLRGFTGDCTCDEAYTGRDLIDPQCVYHYVPSKEAARDILDALTGAES